MGGSVRLRSKDDGRENRMKKAGLIAMAALMLLLAAFAGAPALAEETTPDLDEWTVLFYFCGSDLESKYSYASGNLEEIGRVHYPDNYFSVLVERYGVESEKSAPMGKVNILVETGGSREWHTKDLEMPMDIDPGALQRWRYSYYPYGGQGTSGPYNGYTLLETLPLESMAKPETLADFIRWGTQTCPAKKYALVMWDHGGGARTGLFIDELFDNEVMYLYDLRQALSEGGAHFEAVVIDACLMANLETAWSLKDYADWMVASEETVPGMGTAVDKWLQAMVNNPGCDGRLLGRFVCDETMTKYANEMDEQSRSTLTWSVIDLSKIESLVENWRRFLMGMNDSLRRYPDVVTLYARQFFEAGEYGDGGDDMRELGDLAYDPELVFFNDIDLINDLVKDLSDAVVYSVRGSGRTGARGLSFCYPTDFSVAELEEYARNFPIPEYLAFLDAVSPWEAPAWVYESVEPVPDINEIPEFRLTVKKQLCEDGMPAVSIRYAQPIVDDVYYSLYRLDEASGDVIRLGRTSTTNEGSMDEDLEYGTYRARDPLHWPAVEGVLFCMDLIQTQHNQKLYNVPVQIDSQNCVLRCGRTVGYSSDDEGNPIGYNRYEIYGVWKGYDVNSKLLNRSVEPLSSVSGQEYCFLYPVDDGNKSANRVNYKASKALRMSRALLVEEQPLPPGTYYLDYEVVDVFRRSFPLESIEFHWDGEKVTFPEGFKWEGEQELSAAW